VLTIQRSPDNPDQSRAAEDFGVQVKRCTTCDDWFPADDEFFYKSSRMRDGLLNVCKVCWLENRKRSERSRR